jgi:lipoprotein-anchoring transpeptidase ErfK/SrfK
MSDRYETPRFTDLADNSTAPMGVNIPVSAAHGSAGAGFDDDADSIFEAAGFSPETEGLEDGATGVLGGPAVSGAVKKRIAIIAGVAVAVLLVACGAALFGAHAYYRDRVAPGIAIGGQSVAGKTSDEVRQVVSRQAKDAKIIIDDENGHSVTAHLKDLGVTVDEAQTVNNLMGAKRDNLFVEVNPFSRQTVGLVGKTDASSLNAYLNKHFAAEHDAAMPSGISYDAGQGAFVATEGHAGRMPQNAPVKRAIATALSNPADSRRIKISYETIGTPISLDTAQQAAGEANRRFDHDIVITNGDTGSVTVPHDVIASWIKPDTDLLKGRISLSFDKQAVLSYLNNQMPKQLNQDMVSQQDLVDRAGKVILTSTKGVDGVKIKNCDAVLDQVYGAVTGAQGVSVQIPSDITKFDVKQTVVHTRVVVDKTKQTATVYQDDVVQKTFPVCTGKTGEYETPSGTFFINLRYASQDMRTPTHSGVVVTPGVKWVSYFNGSVGFHAAYWNPDGIAHGDAPGQGSHGCINMYDADAQWIYDNCPAGTLVEVVGTQPSGPVR